MHNRRDTIALATLLIAFALIAVLLRPHADELDTTDVRATTFRSSPSGARALFLLFEELNIPVERELDPWTVRAPAGVLVLLAPSEPPTAREVDRLVSWVRDGGTLIYAAGAADPLRTRLGHRYRALAAATTRDDTATTGVAATPFRHEWTAGVDSVRGFRRAFDFDRSALADSVTVLLHVGNAPTVVSYAYGAGRVIAWSDANPLRNSLLREGGAALLFARSVIAVRGSGVIRFDEFHHGFRTAGPFGALWRFLRDTNIGHGVLQVMVAALALMLLAARRFGAPVVSMHGRRRSPLEHVEAVAAVYRRAHARRTTRQLLMSGLERRLGRRITGADGTIAAAALNPSPQAERLRAEWGRGAEGDLMALSNAVDDYVREVRWR